MIGGKLSSLVRLFGLIAILSATTAGAQELSLPLQGYFHPGRAMPVRWSIDSSGGVGATVRITAPGAITTSVSSVNPDGIAPWIVFDPHATAGDKQFELHPLEDSDFLVGNFVSDETDIARLFPNQHIVTVHVDARDLQSPPMAWETLDAVVLTNEEWRQLGESARDQLFVEGITLAVRLDSKPEGELPWRADGAWWIASADLKLPGIVNADAYAPTDGWSPGRSVEFRKRTFLFAAMYCLVCVGVFLWRSRWMPAAFVVVSIVAGAAIAGENRRESPISACSGTVLVKDEITLADMWVFQMSHRPVTFHVPTGAMVAPVLSDESQFESAGLTLECGNDGEPTAIDGRLSADEPLALVRRRFLADPSSPPDLLKATSPLRLLAGESIYHQFRIVGQLAESTDENVWPTIVFLRR
jgi:hypothetical protein